MLCHSLHFSVLDTKNPKIFQKLQRIAIVCNVLTVQLRYIFDKMGTLPVKVCASYPER